MARAAEFEEFQRVNVEHKPLKETNFYNKESDPDEWTLLLTTHKCWRTLRVTAWALRFADNARAKGRRVQKRTGPLKTEEIRNAKIIGRRECREISQQTYRPLDFN